MYSKNSSDYTSVGRANYAMTLKLADFLIENNMIDDVIYKKILADLDS
jgi:hypothetical protein